MSDLFYPIRVIQVKNIFEDDGNVVLLKNDGNYSSCFEIVGTEVRPKANPVSDEIWEVTETAILLR